MAKIIIVQDREALDLDPMGNLIRKRQIQFMVDNHGPFTYEAPRDTFSIEAFKAFAQRIAQEIKEMEGMEV